MTLDISEAERIYNEIRRDEAIDVSAFSSEEELRRHLESLFHKDSKLQNFTKSERGAVAREAIMSFFFRDWREAWEESEAAMKRLADEIGTLARLEEMHSRGRISRESYRRVKEILEEREAEAPVEVAKEVTGAEIIGAVPRREIGEVPTIELPKEEKPKPKPPEEFRYPEVSFTEREKIMIEDLNRRVAERARPSNVVAMVNNAYRTVSDAVRSVVNWVRDKVSRR